MSKGRASKMSMYCHHDDLVLSDKDVEIMMQAYEAGANNLEEFDEREQRLVKSFKLWVDTVRKWRNPKLELEDWLPTSVDICKSRLFWWIRSGHEPLPFPPPTAYSCPWYELIVDDLNHHIYLDFSLHKTNDDSVSVWVCQCPYNLIEKVSDTEYILGFGPYRFKAWRDVETSLRALASYNPQSPNLYEEYYERDKNDLTKCWMIRRERDLEAQ